MRLHNVNATPERTKVYANRMKERIQVQRDYPPDDLDSRGRPARTPEAQARLYLALDAFDAESARLLGEVVKKEREVKKRRRADRLQSRQGLQEWHENNHYARQEDYHAELRHAVSEVAKTIKQERHSTND